MTPAVYPGMSRAEYDAIAALNYSTLSNYAKMVPAKARHAELNPREISKAMEEGDFLDAVLTNPSRLKTDFVSLPAEPPYPRPTSRQLNAQKPSERTIESIAWWADFDEKRGTRTAIDAQIYSDASKIVEKFDKNPVGNAMIRSPHKQLAIVWEDQRTGILLKGLLDSVLPYDGWTWIADLKSIGDSADPDNFARRAYNFKYPMQAYMYRDGLNTLMPFERKFMWVVVEREGSYEIASYEADDAWMQIGEHDFRYALDTYVNCLESGVWPGYPSGPQKLPTPRWVKLKGINDD